VRKWHYSQTQRGTPRGSSDPLAFIDPGNASRVILRVECLPGATAFVPTLLNSGLPINQFCIPKDFLPLKKRQGETILKSWQMKEKDNGFMNRQCSY